MKYRDRQGREYEQTTSQDSFLAAAYSSAMGRALMKFLGCPIFSKCARVILDSKFSVPFIFGFAEKNGIDMFDYEERMYRSFNDFFTRKIKHGRRFITKDKNLLVSPSDGKVTAYKITQSDTFIIRTQCIIPPRFSGTASLQSVMRAAMQLSSDFQWTIITAIAIVQTV